MAELLVHGAHLGAGQLVELGLYFRQLAAEHVDAVQLVSRRRALPLHERAVEQIGMLADALFARDRAALLGCDDLLLHLLQPSGESAQAGA